jgi:histidine triad (HIT) family protein
VKSEEQDCEFCKIIRGEVKARIVCETDAALAFFPLKPAALGHTLVVPKKHVRDLWSVDEALAARVMEAAVRVGKAIRLAVQPDGMNLISSVGQAATQTIFHLHLHMVPRWSNDHIGIIWPPSKPWTETVKDEVADSIRDACHAPQ